MNNFLKKILKIFIFSIFLNATMLAIGSDYSETEISSDESSSDNKPYYIFPDQITQDIQMWYGSAMTAPSYEEIEKKNKLDSYDSDDSGTEQDYKKQVELFEKRNQLLIDTNLLEPLAKIYYIERCLSYQIRQDNFEQIDINDLGLNILEINNRLQDFTNLFVLDKLVDFSYNNKYYPDRDEESINPILKLVNIFIYFINYYHDYDRELYVEMAKDFLNNLKETYNGYSEYNEIDISLGYTMFSQIPEYIKYLEQNILNLQKDNDVLVGEHDALILQIIESLKANSYNKAFDYMKKYNNKYGYLQGFSDQNFKSLVLDLIRNNKIEKLIDCIFNQIMLSDESHKIFKLDLVDFLLKIEEILVYEYSNSNDKEIKKQLYSNIQSIFDGFLNYDKENIDELREFIDGNAFDFSSDEGFMPSILELLSKNNLCVFIDKYKYLIQKYIGLVGILDLTSFECLGRISNIENFYFQFDAIFNSIFIHDYEVEKSRDMYLKIERLSSFLLKQKDSLIKKANDFIKDYNFLLDLKINKSNSYERIDSLTSERFFIELQKDLDILIFKSVLTFFEYFIRYYQNYQNNSERDLLDKYFDEFKNKVRKDFDQIKKIKFKN